MRNGLLLLIILVITLQTAGQNSSFVQGGFMRSGVYIFTGSFDRKINTVFADAALKLNIKDDHSFIGFADLRTGERVQYGNRTPTFNAREIFGTYYNGIISISAGKKIIRWGKTDFFNPLSKFNPVDYSFRSPDNDDMDMGEFIGEADISPSRALRISIVASPLWNPSVLLTKPMTLPQNVHLSVPDGFQADYTGFSFGMRTAFTIRQIDFGLQWFHGTDPMPGLKLDSADFTIVYNPYIAIRGVPYGINSFGADFETVVSSVVIRGALAYSKPLKDKKENEWVPFPQLEWVTGIDWTPGNFHITAEYTGKIVLDYYTSPYSPLIGTKIDLAKLITLFSTPGFDPVEYARLQTEAFNRLYNNQMNEYYHSAGLRIEDELFYDRLIPSLSGMYNFTSHDLMIIPSIKYKPADNISITVGMEYYSGKNGGLYDLIDDFMDAAFVSIRVDF
jgi:hypothetical protein